MPLRLRAYCQPSMLTGYSPLMLLCQMSVSDDHFILIKCYCAVLVRVAFHIYKVLVRLGAKYTPLKIPASPTLVIDFLCWLWSSAFQPAEGFRVLLRGKYHLVAPTV